MRHIKRITPVIFSIFLALVTFAISAHAAERRTPLTAEQHFALARDHRAQADAARREQSEHLEKAEKYRKNPLNAQTVRGQINSQLAKLIAYETDLAAKAGARAAQAEKAADYHEFRGKELQGE